MATVIGTQVPLLIQHDNTPVNRVIIHKEIVFLVWCGRLACTETPTHFGLIVTLDTGRTLTGLNPRRVLIVLADRLNEN